MVPTKNGRNTFGTLQKTWIPQNFDKKSGHFRGLKRKAQGTKKLGDPNQQQQNITTTSKAFTKSNL